MEDGYSEKHHKIIITIKGRGTTNETGPFPDLDFSANDYVILWTDDMLRKVDVTSIENSPSSIIIKASEVIYHGSPEATGTCGAFALISIPKQNKQMEVVWPR